jgi:Transposase DDE domain group 1
VRSLTPAASVAAATVQRSPSTRSTIKSLPRLPRQLGLCTLLAYNLLCWLKLLALPEGERTSYAKRLRFRFIAVAATVGRSGRRLVLRLSASYPLLADFVEALRRLRGLARAPT